MRLICVVLVLSVGVACGHSAGSPTGGVEGRVTIGPTCPVERQSSPCPPSAWVGTVRATASDGGVHEAATGEDGSYALQLEPGSYTVAPVVDGVGPPTAEPVTVKVGTAMQQLDLQLDSGIR